MINCIYLHVPFCKNKCPYCSFCSFPLLKYKKNYIEALIKEIKFYYKNNPLDTIYFGGGTPSLLDKDEILEILNCFNFNNKTSVTLEANPSDLTKEKLYELKNLGINRISLGVQSFNNSVLNSIGRKHSSDDVLSVLKNIKSTGFDDFSIDLMYGLPNQNIKSFEDDLDIALKLDIPHISLYGLKIEEGTYFYKYPPKVPSLDIQADMYKLAVRKLSQKYKHYEFSNFAKNEKYYSRHNLKYWTRENYFGFGLSASGFVDNKRYTNTYNFKEYLKNPCAHNFELLNLQQQLEEEIFLGLRLKKGIDFNLINKKYNIDIYKKYKKTFEKYINTGFMEKTPRGVKLTLDGVLLSNEILCEFILT